ncbi:adenylate isopentenyltransferase 3, chloroplastic [Pistacia vera]|uniref:adenylate isopentenyltransferase 3, chloroplastic n=1 Tax=Pistacia vera TaxID=55513 RepID=UPI001262AD20|nr:adenylate isopentenyltransferase 3, chloroplastic [Pistacia vera]
MRISTLLLNHTSPSLSSLDIPTGRLKMDLLLPRRQKEKVLIVMGATGAGKSKLSIDLATRFPAEIINSDKMQMFEGLDITTNKITEAEQCGILHHMLGILSPNAEFTAANFCEVASLAVESTLSRGQLPIIVGGSNSYIEALIDDKDFIFRKRYDCCFLWVDVSMPVLHSFVSDRVDRMVQNGMVEEVRNIFDPKADYSKGIRKAIGVPEFHQYFKEEPFLDEENREKALKKAIQEIKDNTCELACRQLKKIHRLRTVKGWNIHRIDATEVFRKRGKAADEAWEKRVVVPSTTLVAEFLYNLVSMEVPFSVADIRDYITQCLVA